MKHAVFAGCLAVMMLLSLSLLLLRPTAQPDQTKAAAGTQTMEAAQPQAPPTLEQVAEPGAMPVSYDASHTVAMTDGQQIQNLSMTDYLTGVVLAEMPASFEIEALKAQAVAARTFCMKQSKSGKHADADICGSGRCCQQYAAPDSMRQKLGESYEQYLQKVEKAVLETDGLVMRYAGALIDAVYFSCSGGRTESAAAVWGGEVPYLQPVDSPGEEGSSRYADSVTVETEAFRRAILEQEPAAQLEGNPAGWFGAVTRTAGGGVDTVQIGGAAFRGTQVRSLFSLRSTNFTVAVTDRGIEFSTLGNGHRVGMSQYGAQAMAQGGSDFREILSHYYAGVQIEAVE